MRTLLLTTIVLVLAATSATAAPPLRKILNDLNVKDFSYWIYNDLDAALKSAKSTGKPIFVTFRCVPCKACKSFDAEVADGNDIIKQLARKEFISLRLVEMKGVPLTQFQFDYDLNWAAMFINADGEVYARYGTQSAEGPDAYNSIASLEKTMRRVLKFHRERKYTFTSKRGPAKPYKTALEMPGLHNKDRYAGETKVSNCIHCHNIHDAEVAEAYDKGTFKKEMLWRYPLPENVGIKIDRDDGRIIESITPNSPAAKARLKPGDEIILLGAQPIASIADIQWVLHSIPSKTGISIKYLRDGSEGNTRLKLDGDWKMTDISWRGSIYGVPPRLRIWTPGLTDQEKKKHGLSAETTALVAKWINTNEEAGRVARKAGLREGDVILELDGKPLKWTDHAKFHTHIKLNYSPGDKLPITVLRKGKRIPLEIPLVR